MSIGVPDTNIVNQTACQSYVWFGETLTESGIYYHSESGEICDNVTELHLSISVTDTTVVNQTACQSYVWFGETLTESGIYYHSESGEVCDNVTELHLSIGHETEEFDTLHICESALPYSYADTTFEPGTPEHSTYTFRYTNALGCDSTLHLTLEIHPNPTVTITGPTEIELGEDAELTANGAETYLWSTGETTNTIRPEYADTYYVTGTSEWGCSSTDSIIFTIVDAIEDENGLAQIQLYPNPATSAIIISSNNNLIIKELNIVDGSGRIVRQCKTAGTQYEINISQWASGIYFAKIITTEGITVKKFYKIP